MVQEGTKVEEHANLLPLVDEEETIQIESCCHISSDHQNLSFSHAFQDPFTSFLQSLHHDGYLFLNHSFRLQLYVELPILKIFVDIMNRGQSGI